MKKLFTIAIFFTFFTNMNFAQISQGGKPYFLTHNSKTTIQEYTLEKVNETWKENIKQDAEKNGTIEIIAKNISTDYNLYNSGKWSTLKNGDKIWRIKIKAEDAKGINAHFKDFFIPQGAKLYIYNEDYSQIIGAFTNANNDKSKLFASEIIFGNTMIVEYYEPRNLTIKGSFTIEKIGSFFKEVYPYKSVDGFGDSQSCEININCSEGTNWQDEKKGVARILVTNSSGQGWCSGTLVNNTNLDCKPYFLTAYHCGNTSTTSDFNQWIFYFNYEFSGCSSSGVQPSWNSITGSSLKARANNLSSSTTSSDFLLVELNQDVPTSYDVYYNGWNISTSSPSSGVSIHHPAGDVKKISSFNNSMTNVGVNWSSSGSGYMVVAGSTHWNVFWSATANGLGVSEGGSSGSPLFNNSGYVIGTLTGGGSACVSGGAGSGTGPDKADQYGKMSYHWTSNSSSSSRQLKPWLDPTNSGVTSMIGTYSPCASTLDIALTQLISPVDDVCDNNFYPQVQITNNGSVTITSATISYQVNSSSVVDFSWTGSLGNGQSVMVDLTPGTTASVNNSFTATVSNPNGTTDSNVSNNSLSSNFTTNVQKVLPLHNTFEFSLLQEEWILDNYDDTTTWELSTNIGSYGTSNTCMYMDNWDYDAPGQWDWFISDAYDLSDTSDNEIYFDLAYTYYKQNNGTEENHDTLGIAYSIDCGQSYYWLWKFGGAQLATVANGLGEEFVPQNDDWQTKNIPLNSNILGQSSVMFAFIGINGYGNNMYIDNIGVGHTLLNVSGENSLENNISIFPNPTKDNINIDFNLEKINNIEISIINTVGQLMIQKTINNVQKSVEKIELKSLPKGIYYIKIINSTEQKIMKFVKE